MTTDDLEYWTSRIHGERISLFLTVFAYLFIATSRKFKAFSKIKRKENAFEEKIFGQSSELSKWIKCENAEQENENEKPILARWALHRDRIDLRWKDIAKSEREIAWS